MGAVHGVGTAFSDDGGGDDRGGWEEDLLDLVQVRVEYLPPEEAENAHEEVGNRGALLPPPPAWDVERGYGDLVDSAMQALLEKRYAEAQAAYTRALESNPEGPYTSTIRANLSRLQKLLADDSERDGH